MVCFKHWKFNQVIGLLHVVVSLKILSIYAKEIFLARIFDD